MIKSSHIKDQLLMLVKSTNALTPVPVTYYSPKLGKMITRKIPKNLNPNIPTPKVSFQSDDNTDNAYLALPPMNKPKSSKASQVSKDKVKEFKKMLGDTKEALMEAIKKMGMHLDTHGKHWETDYAKEGIKYMRANETLSLHIEDGLDVNETWKKAQALKENAFDQPNDTSTNDALPPLNRGVKNADGSWSFDDSKSPIDLGDITETNQFFSNQDRFRTDTANDTSIYKRWYNKLSAISEDFFKSFNQYTRHSRDLLGWLRGYYKPSKYSAPHFWSMWGKKISEFDFFKKQTQYITDGIDQFELSHDIYVYRVMDVTTNKELLDSVLEAANTGKLWTDKGFIKKRRKTPSFSYGDIIRNKVSI